MGEEEADALGVGDGVAEGVGEGVGDGVGFLVGTGVGFGVGFGEGDGLGLGLGLGLMVGVDVGSGEGDGAGVSEENGLKIKNPAIRSRPIPTSAYNSFLLAMSRLQLKISMKLSECQGEKVMSLVPRLL